MGGRTRKQSMPTYRAPAPSGPSPAGVRSRGSTFTINSFRRRAATFHPATAASLYLATPWWRACEVPATDVQRAVPRDVPATARSALASRRHSYLFGIDGEQTQHLLWRLMDGELAQSMADDPQLDVLLMIGTNNLGVGHSSLETVKGVLAVVRYLLTYTKSANIIVGALLPRFGGTHMRHFGSSALKETNHAIANGVAQMQGASEQGRARFVDCSSSLVSTSNAETHARYNVDGVHPSARGYAALLECLA